MSGNPLKTGNPLKSLIQQMGKLFGSGQTKPIVDEIIGVASNIINPHTESINHSDKSEPSTADNTPSNHAGHAQAHGNYQFSPYFEQAVECINTVAGLIIISSFVLAGVNLLLVVFNANFGENDNCMTALV
jgi:hypothetical protein